AREQQFTGHYSLAPPKPTEANPALPGSEGVADAVGGDQQNLAGVDVGDGGGHFRWHPRQAHHRRGRHPRFRNRLAAEVLLIATDGIGDPLGTGQGGVGNLLRDVLTRPCPPSLIEFAHAMDFSRETFDDDRTLVAVWPRGKTTDEAAAPPAPRSRSPVEGLQ
ncbi:hypothetical protein, partial [Mycobacterium alsense]|uniref:hypothetical protein n=1 Tax=Mycobacterium alsense TaxID=324058 RepID=UPI000AC61FC2